MATGGQDRHQPSPENPSDPAVSRLADFPECSAYSLQFKTVTRDGKEHVINDSEHYVLADTEAAGERLNTLADRFSRAGVQIDHKNKVVILKDKGTTKKSPHDWIKPVMDSLCKEVKVVKHKVINTGPGAEELKPRIDVKFAAAGVTCMQSRDNQSLLLLYTDDRIIPKVEQFVKDQSKDLAYAGEIITSSRLRVSVFKGDITKLRVDGIVSAVDRLLSCSGGVSRAIKNAAGRRLVDETQQYIKLNGQAKVTGVVDTTGGDLECKRVLHAVGPRWEDYEDKGLCTQHLGDTIFNCLVRACELGLTSLAIPAVSSGNFRVPREMATRCYQNAAKRFDQSNSSGSLTHIYFVDIDLAVIPAMRESFRELHMRGNEEENTLRLMLVGKIGVGKSALGNNLLKTPGKFLSKKSFVSVTDKTDRGITFLPEKDIELQVVDTPGLFEPGETHQDKIKHIKKEIVKSLSLLLPGPHVVLVVFRSGRYTPTDALIFTEIQKLFPHLKDYMIAVFTDIDNDEELENLLDEAKDEMKKLIDGCGGRTAGINNKHDSPLDLNQQVDSLTTKIVDLYKANGRKPYTNEVLLRCLQLMMSSEYTGKSLEDMKQEVLDGNEKKLMELCRDEQIQQNWEKAPSSCTIL